MRCPFCSSEELKVTDSRNVPEMSAIRRRRECLRCQKRFTTFETIELALQVCKRDKRYEDFQQHKLIKGMEAACYHTGISLDQIKEIAFQITQEVTEQQPRRVTTAEIGEMVMRRMQELDAVAYIRYACVYRRFKDVNEVMEAIQSIDAKDEQNSICI